MEPNKSNQQDVGNSKKTNPASTSTSTTNRITSLSNAPVATTTSDGYSGFFTFTQPRRRGGKRKIPIEYIKDKTRRQITFSKRKGGIMKKAYELGHLTGSEVMVVVVSETNQVYTFATDKFQQYFANPEAKLLLHQCIHSTEHSGAAQEPVMASASASGSGSSASSSAITSSTSSSSVVPYFAPPAILSEDLLAEDEETPDEPDEE